MIHSNSDSVTLSLLGIEFDGSFYISKTEILDDIKYIHIQRDPLPTFCPICSSRMHSNRIYVRTVKHPVLQDTTQLVLKVHQRQWICTNPTCRHSLNEQFPFLDKWNQSTNTLFYPICEALKDLTRTTASVARQYHLSDTQIHDIFTAHVDVPPLPLPEYISVDEVYLNISSSKKYAFIIMDFLTGEIVDIIHNRWSNTLYNYFTSIPAEQRKNVNVIISDAYKPYLELPKYYFPNAKSILDSFHVIKFLINEINIYINRVMKKYQDRDKEKLKKKNHDFNYEYRSIKDSREVLLLRNYRWILLKNKDKINYSTHLYYNQSLEMNVDTYKLERMFMELDDNFEKIRFLKEKYIQFNQELFDDSSDAEQKLDRLIKEYEASDLIIFKNFATFLKRYKKEIVNSFCDVIVSRKSTDDLEQYYSRLSNGPMESFNRKPKDYKRNARGFSNFNYTRNRILWATVRIHHISERQKRGSRFILTEAK